MLTNQDFGAHHGKEARVVRERMLHATDAHQRRQISEEVYACCPMETVAMGEIHWVLLDI